MKNLSLYFNKLYYQDLHIKDLDDSEEGAIKFNKKSEVLFDHKFKASDDYFDLDQYHIKGLNKFRLKAAYPGVVVGMGTPHGLKIKSDFKAGFTFEYVSGQPYIPGSSIKGILRSYFKNHPEVVSEILNSKKMLGINWTNQMISELEEKIFKVSDNQIVFLDAVVSNCGKDGRVIADDYITPHDTELVDPRPLRILKIKEGTELEFRFIINNKINIIDNHGMDEKQQLELFKILIQEFGIGAKTNTGYGRLIQV